jgi:hypothetical protein
VIVRLVAVGGVDLAEAFHDLVFRKERIRVHRVRNSQQVVDHAKKIVPFGIRNRRASIPRLEPKDPRLYNR